MSRTLICPVCGIEFTTEKNAMKYCSPTCRRKASRSTENSGVRNFTCECCGKEFKSERRRKYCSTQCCRTSNSRQRQKFSNINSGVTLSLAQVALLSREAGLSYGEYVQKLRLA